MLYKVVDDVEEQRRLKEERLQSVDESCDEELQRKINEILKRLEKKKEAKEKQP